MDHDWVLVHDAARCLITPELIDRLIDACDGDEVGGLLAHPLADTLKHRLSLDSIANAKKEAIDSTAEQRKENIDSLTELKKDQLAPDSANNNN